MLVHIPNLMLQHIYHYVKDKWHTYAVYTHTHPDFYQIRNADTFIELERDEASEKVCLGLGAILGPLALLLAFSDALTSCL